MISLSMLNYLLWKRANPLSSWTNYFRKEPNQDTNFSPTTEDDNKIKLGFQVEAPCRWHDGKV